MLRASLLCTLLAAAAAQTKRPIQPADYGSFRSIASPRLSADGRWVVYGVFPQEGDGHAIVREIASGRQYQVGAGQRPEPAPPEPGSEGPAVPRGLTAGFSDDGKWLAMITYPGAAQMAQARKERKRPADLPKNGLALVNLESGQVARVDGVKSFQFAEQPAAAFAYLKESGELVIRTLATGAERTYKAISEFKLGGDGLWVVAIGKGGAWAYPAAGGEPVTLASGEGKYTKLAADDAGQRFAFVKDATLISWRAGEPAAETLASGVSPYPNLTFTADGERLFYGVPARPDKAREEKADGESAVYDLWHYRDDFIQPMQRVRAKQERERSYRWVYSFPEKKATALASAEMAEVTPVRAGNFSTGLDDRAYRRLAEHDTRYNDVYSVDLRTGGRRALARKHSGTPSLSPDGTYVLLFEGRHWVSYELATGERRNLTALAGRPFHREDDDRPGEPGPYAPPEWTKDGTRVLLADRYDIWEAAPDASLLRLLTDGAGRAGKLTFRVVRWTMDGRQQDPKDRGVDSAQPVTLSAKHEDSQESGFYQDSFDPADQPRQLILAPQQYGNLVKSRDGNQVVFTSGSFTAFPDLHATDVSFARPKRLSTANPQMAELAWGTSELMRYRNADGKMLSAALYKPANFDPAKKYPMIVYIYERLSQNVHDFVEPRPGHSINASVYTSNGYVVLMPDIVYEAGYPGPSALKCVLPAVDQAVSLGFVDPERVGIQGHSWGGYQIAYMVTRTSRFRAAAPGALVGNMFSAYDGIRWGPGIPRQFQYEKGQSRIGGSPWEMPMRYIENSPLFMADRVTTPLLMLHNDADDAVPWYQGIEFFLALRRLGKEAYMFNYNGEPHGIRKRPNQKDYALRLQQFFDHHLKGAAKPDWMERGRPFIEKEPFAPAAAGTAPTDQPGGH
jgi:dipeptidyl aminopeptidase/acylaminoacyl peptidase